MQFNKRNKECNRKYGNIKTRVKYNFWRRDMFTYSSAHESTYRHDIPCFCFRCILFLWLLFTAHSVAGKSKLIREKVHVDLFECLFPYRFIKFTPHIFVYKSILSLVTKVWHYWHCCSCVDLAMCVSVCVDIWVCLSTCVCACMYVRVYRYLYGCELNIYIYMCVYLMREPKICIY